MNHLLSCGLVLACVTSTLGCAGAQSESAEDQDLKKAPAFLSTAASSSSPIAGMPAQRHAPSSQLRTLLAHVSTTVDPYDTTHFFAAGYTLQPADLVKFKSSADGYATQKAMAHDFMTHTDAWLNWMQPFDQELESALCKRVDLSKALESFKSFHAYQALGSPDSALTPAARSTLETGAKSAVQSLVQGVGAASLYTCHWDDRDETRMDALVVVQFATNEVRTLAVFEGVAQN